MAFCCLSVPTVVEGREKFIVDLQTLLCDKAWNMYRTEMGPFEKLFLKRKDFIIEVPENYFRFEKVSQVLKEHKPLATLSKDDDFYDNNALATEDGNHITQTKEPEVLEDMLQGRDVARHHISGPEHISLDTEFKNDTAKPQTYKFRFEKQRKSEISVNFHRGFTFGGKANFSVDVPAGASVGAEASMQYQVTRTDGEKFEETMLMEATSDINVGPNSCYTANVQLEERNLHYNFTVRMRMTMPQGVAPIYIKQRKNDKLVCLYKLENLHQVFNKKTVDCAEPVKEEDTGNVIYTAMDFIIKGLINGSIACNHKIHLESDESPEQKRKAQNVHS